MKNILFVVPYISLGGAEKQFRHLINGLSEKYADLEITVLSLNKATVEERNLLNNNVKLITLNISLPKQIHRKKILTYFLIYLNVYFFLLKYRLFYGKFDVVLSYRQALSPLIPIFKFSGKKIVFSERTASNNLIKHKWMSWFFNLSNNITCNSQITAQYLETIGVRNVKIIYNGINSEKILELKEDFTFREVAVIARIHPEKNQIVVLEGLKKIKDLKVTFIGECVDENYYNFLIHYARENRLSDRIQFIPYTTNVIDYYEKSDFLILPSFEEGMSNVILESMLHHKYIIASDIPANKIIIGNNGGLFDPKSSFSLVQEIEKVKAMNDSNLKLILKNNSSIIQSQFSIEKMIEEYANLILDK